MRWLEDINFNMLSLTLLFKRYVIAIFDINVLKEVSILYVISIRMLPTAYSKIKLSY